MGRPAKPASVLRQEGKSHRTKAELEQRENGEQKLLTGMSMKEEAAVKRNPVSHREFIRIRKLLKTIGKDDALYQNAVNRYAKLVAETGELEMMREEIMQEKNLENINRIERMLLQKRKALLELEKESCMTVAASLRAIPKKVMDDTEDDPIRELLE